MKPRVVNIGFAILAMICLLIFPLHLEAALSTYHLVERTHVRRQFSLVELDRLIYSITTNFSSRSLEFIEISCTIMAK